MLVKIEINLLLQLFNKNEKKRTFCTTLTISMYDDQETGYCSCDYCGVFTLPDTEAETRDRPKLPSGSVYYLSVSFSVSDSVYEP